jgi:hypothetical protein
MNFDHAAAGGVQVAKGVFDVCDPDNSGSVKVTAPTPAPIPTVPYVAVTTFAASSCQGIFSEAFNFIIGACTALPGTSDVYGIASVTGTTFALNGYVNAQCTTPIAAGGVQIVTSVIGACGSTPNNIGSFRAIVRTPAPLPTVPFVVVTRYASPSCQGVFVGGAFATNFIIGACTALPGSAGYGIASVTGTSVTITGYANAQCTTPVSEAKVSAVIGACTSSPDNTGSFKVFAPMPPLTPTVPFVVVTTYAIPSCQGIFSRASNFIIGACTAVPGSSDVYGIASVSGTVRRHHDECALYASLLPLVPSYSCARARAENHCVFIIYGILTNVFAPCAQSFTFNAYENAQCTSRAFSLTMECIDPV